MLTYFRARTKDFGAFICFKQAAITATASATVTVGLAAISDSADTAVAPGHTAYIDEVYLASTTVPAGSSTIQLSIKKYDASAGAAVTIVNAFDAKSITASKAKRLTIVTTLSESQRTMHFGDFLYAELVSAGTVTTNLTGGLLSVKLKLLT